MVLVTAGELELRTLEVQVSSFARKLSVAVRGFHGLHELRHGHIADRSWFSRTLSSSSGTGRSGRPAASLEACSASGCGPAHSSRNAVSAASKGSGEGAVVVHGKTPGERGGREPGPIQPPPIDLAWTCDVPRAGGGSPAVAAAAAAAAAGRAVLAVSAGAAPARPWPGGPAALPPPADPGAGTAGLAIADCHGPGCCGAQPVSADGGQDPGPVFGTVPRAIDILVKEGLAQTVPGRGTFVTAPTG
jgi:hypothetical protein